MSELITTTKRLHMRKMKDGDQDLLYSISREASFFSSVQISSEFEELYRQINWKENNAPDIYNAMIFLNDSGDFIGKICMQNIDRDLPELGIDILKAYQNQGYGPEAIIAFCNWYFLTYGLRKVKVRIDEDNAHSIHIFEKLGAKYDQSTTYMPKDALEALEERLPGADLSALSKDNVRNYLLRLPIWPSITNEQVFNFYKNKDKDKDKVECPFTEELVKAGFRQDLRTDENGDEISPSKEAVENKKGYRGYIDSYILSEGTPNYKEATPSQYWHLFSSYRDRKGSNTNKPNSKHSFRQNISCPELYFWMIEVSEVEDAKKELTELKEKILGDKAKPDLKDGKPHSKEEIDAWRTKYQEEIKNLFYTKVVPVIKKQLPEEK